MEGITEKTINITSVSEKEKMLEVFDGKTKFKLWKTKVDGTESKAYTQWKEFGLGFGESIVAGVREEEKEYNGHKYMDRTIAFFSTDKDGTPNIKPSAESEAKLLMDQHIAEYHMDDDIKDEVDPSDLPF
jgi:hypothetical protein